MVNGEPVTVGGTEQEPTYSFVMPALDAVITAEFISDGVQLGIPAVVQNETLRTVTITAVPGAESYTIELYDTFESAETGTDPVAWAEGITTTGAAIQLRHISNYQGDATRILPDGYIPAGIGASNGPPARPDEEYGRDDNNLIPGAYWIRVRAVADPDSGRTDSGLSSVPAETAVHIISMGPTETRDIIEKYFTGGGVAADLKNPNSPLRLVDIRSGSGDTLNTPAEQRAHGTIRFFDEVRYFGGITYDYLMDPELGGKVFPNKDATILLL